MTAQENMALVRSLFDLYNSHQSDPAWLDNVELRFCEGFQIKGGKIVSLHVYYDSMTMLQQLGLVPAMG